MYLLIDNYDSFTYNLADLVVETERDVQVCRCDRIGRNKIAALKPAAGTDYFASSDYLGIELSFDWENHL